MDMSQYLDIFIEETKEHLQSLNQCLLQLEKSPTDSAMLNEIFRVAHTLKGMSATMGFNRMAKLTHDMENVLHALRSNEIKVNTKLIDLLFKCLDALENYLNNIVSKSNEGTNEYSEIIQDLNNVIKAGPESLENKTEEQATNATEVVKSAENTKNLLTLNQYEQNVVNKANEMGMNVFQITLMLNKGCVLKSARAFIIFHTLERYSEIIKSEPKVEDIEDEKFDFDFSVVVVSKESKELFLKELNSISEIDDIQIDPLTAKPFENDEVKKAEVKKEEVEKNVIGNVVETQKTDIISKKEDDSFCADQVSTLKNIPRLFNKYYTINILEFQYVWHHVQ